jgi:hypothetical protein
MYGWEGKELALFKLNGDLYGVLVDQHAQFVWRYLRFNG